MKNNFYIIIIFIFFFNITIEVAQASEDFTFESKSIEFNNSSNLIIANEGVKITSENGIEILADNSSYNKSTKILILKDAVSVNDTINKATLKSEKITYNKNREKIFSHDKTEILFNESYTLYGEDITFDRKNLIISSNSKAKLKDKSNNTLKVDGFEYSLETKTLKTDALNFLDSDKNNYISKNSIVDLSNDKIAAKDIELYFNDEGEFGSNARLKGTSLITEKDKTVISNGIFTTCKKNDNCPPWTMQSKKITHDKKKKRINYEKSVLNLYDIPVFYFPKFFHPDPTVKRQSGFLIPSIVNSTSNGNSVLVPYYYVISENKDFTFSPQFYANKDFLIQNEYRQEERFTSHVTDFSLKKLESSSKSHFFSNTKKKLNNDFEIAQIEFNIERTSNDTYLKKSNIKTETRNETNQSLLNSYVKFDATGYDYKIFSEMSVYEDLSKKKNSDKYQYIFPNFTLSKLLRTSTDLKGDLNFQVSGSSRKKNTNVEEKYLINDLNYNSKSFFSKFGSISNFEILFKNTLKKGKNSSEYDDKTLSRNYSTFVFKSSLPLKKKNSNFISNLTPKLLARYNPDNSQNIGDLDRKLNLTNLFSTNRLGLNDAFEGGQSLTLGLDYDIKNAENEKFLSLNIGQVFRDTNEPRLPKKSTMHNKYSDIIGGIEFSPGEFIDLKYKFSADNNLQTMNSSKIETELNINNFVTTFEFLEENNDIGSESYLANDIKYSFNQNNSILYNTRRNRKTDLTEFYNLIYEYRNDCLVAAIEYNKNYYQDRDLKPNEEIFFKITITPFASVNSPSLK